MVTGSRQRGIGRRGFTLIETLALLAVVAVGIVLVAPPGCGGGRWQSHRALCQSNLKQIGLGMFQYVEDYDQKYPLIVLRPPGPTGGSWRTAIEPYLRDRQLWLCDSNPIRDSISPADNVPQSYDVTDVGPVQRKRPITTQQVYAPGTTILFMEENGDTPQTQQPGVEWDHDYHLPGWTNILFAGHLETTDCAFADGHVKGMKPLSTIAGGVNMWHLNNHDPVTPGALRKLQAAEAGFR